MWNIDSIKNKHIIYTYKYIQIIYQKVELAEETKEGRKEGMKNREL
jgi:hypothetical protein